MSSISTISLFLAIALTIKNNRRLDAGIAVASAVTIYILAYIFGWSVSIYLNNIVTDNIVVNALIASIKPFIIDNIQGETQPAVIGLLLIALYDYARNKYRSYYH